MARFKSSNSVRWRKPVYIFEDDPKAKTPQKFEAYQSKAGADVYILKIEKNIKELPKYPEA